MTARTAQLQQNGMSQQQAQQTAQSEWAQGYAQSGNVAYGMPSGLTSTPAAAAATGAAWQAPTSAQWMTARVAQLQQNGQSAQQATQTAQAEWAQGFAQSGNVAYGMPSGISFTAPAAQAATPAAGGTSSQDQYTTARIAQLQGTGMSAAQAAQTAQAEWAQGYAQSGNVAYGMPSTTTPAAATTTPSAPTSPTTAATGQPGGQPVQTLAAWQAQQTAAQNYLTMMAGLRGPADYAQYQKVLGATPGGMKDLVAAAAGQYIPGGGATTGVQPTAVNMSNFLGSATGGQPTDPSGQAALNTLVAPNQMAPGTWNNLTPSQQQLLLGQWESQGYTKDDAQALFNQSLPKYAPQTGIGAGSFKLQ
jgi:hypothetical protein